MKQQPTIPEAPTFREKLAAFFRTGLLIVSASLLLTIGLKQIPGLIPASATPQANLPICHIETALPQVALTFDVPAGTGSQEDGSDALLDEILAALAASQTKATFFLNGAWADTHPDKVKELAAAGHELASSGETYTDLAKLTPAQCKQELSTLHARIRGLTGLEMSLFRPPFASWSGTVLETAASCGYHSILWDVDTLDWKGYGATSLVTGVLSHPNLASGSILLLHSNSPDAAAALPTLIDSLRQQGYEPVPVSQLLQQPVGGS